MANVISRLDGPSRRSRLGGIAAVVASPRRWIPVGLIAVAALAVLLPDGLATDARLSLFAFAVALVLWTLTPLDTAFVAIGVVLALTVAGVTSQDQLYGSLGSDVVWLMIGAFVIGVAVQETGLATRLTSAVVRRARTLNGVTWLLTAAIIPLAFIIPSTSGRAAVLLPVYRSLAENLPDRRADRGLALLLPSVVLVSTVVSLVGAGSHIIANDLLRSATGESISFIEWALWGLPYGIAASAATCWIVGRLGIPADARRAPIKLEMADDEQGPLPSEARRVVAIVAVMAFLWCSEGFHGLAVATVAILGAVAMTIPRFGPIDWRDGLKGVSWNLILFVAAATLLGQALIDTGAAGWIVGELIALSGLNGNAAWWAIVGVLGIFALTSHLYMTSHTARAAALIPPLIGLATSLGFDPVAVVFLAAIGMDFCLTFPVSSKALLVFAEEGNEGGAGSKTFSADLARLSALLFPVHLGLMFASYLLLWRWTGLAL